MSIGFHFDDIEEAYFNNKYASDWDSAPIGVPYHDNDKEEPYDDLSPIGAPYHD